MVRRDGKKMVGKVIIIVFLIIVLVVLGMILVVNYQMSKIPNLSAEDVLATMTKDKKEAVITIGIIKDGEASFKVYGEDAKELPPVLHTYEIGSLTKTFTGALIGKAVMDGKISLDDTIDKYLELPGGKTYPTIKQLLTHTSGYKGYYFEKPMIGNLLHGRNDFRGITDEMLVKRVANVELDAKEYSFRYSNFGFAILGLIVEKVYDTDYTTLVNNYSKEELGLYDTKISDELGDLGKYWEWEKGDGYIPAGAITSNIEDMLVFTKRQLEEPDYVKQSHMSLQRINATNKTYQTMGINLYEIGMAWIIDRENNILWHNGGTGNYNCYLGFNLEKQTAVVVLSNLSPTDRIPATVLGIKILEDINKDS